MRTVALASLIFVLIGQSARANTEEVGAAISHSLAACEKWVLDPHTWANSIADFPRNIGLEGSIAPQSAIPELLLPPIQLRKSNHYWYTKAGENEGIYLTTSDSLPICHIAGGGPSDFQPAVEAFLKGADFASRWRNLEHSTRGDIVTDRFVSREEPKFELVVSRATQAGGRTDRVQLLATAQYNLGN